MASWIWVLIPLAAIIGGLLLEYQKNRMKMMDSRTDHNEKELEELKTHINKLQSRVENLEAIAAGEPEDFKRRTTAAPLDWDEEQAEMKEENRKLINDLANKRRNK